MNRSKRLQKNPEKWQIASLVKFFALVLLTISSSCTEQLTPRREPPPSIQEIDHSVIQKINSLLALKNYPLAKKQLSRIREISLKKSMEMKVGFEWDQNDIQTAEEDLKKGLGVESLAKLDSFRKRDPVFFKNHTEMIPDDLAETYLDSLISTGKEFQALNEAKNLFKLPKPLEKKVESDAYIHLAQRRLSEGKDHFALLDIKNGLLIDPSNQKLESMQFILKKRQTFLTEQGFKQYGKQHLRRAIRYWGDALLLSPGDSALQGNIMQAREMLERLKSMQHNEQTSTNSPAK